MGDETYRIFLSTVGKNEEDEPSDLVRFLKYVGDASVATGDSTDDLIHQIENRIGRLKRDRGMEVRYMLFGEMLDDERREGREEAREALFRLMELMEADGAADKIPFLRKDKVFYQKMCEKYHIGV